MRPKLGDRILYTRLAGETFTGLITKVTLTRVTPFVQTTQRGPHTITRTLAASASTLESDYDVWVGYAAHTASEAGDQFAQSAPYDAGGAPGTWRWPA